MTSVLFFCQFWW